MSPAVIATVSVPPAQAGAPASTAAKNAALRTPPNRPKYRPVLALIRRIAPPFRRRY
jgi:hypothetical protein